MVQINFARREVNLKLVYYGPGMAGSSVFSLAGLDWGEGVCAVSCRKRETDRASTERLEIF